MSFPNQRLTRAQMSAFLVAWLRRNPDVTLAAVRAEGQAEGFTVGRREFEEARRLAREATLAAGDESASSNAEDRPSDRAVAAQADAGADMPEDPPVPLAVARGEEPPPLGQRGRRNGAVPRPERRTANAQRVPIPPVTATDPLSIVRKAVADHERLRDALLAVRGVLHECGVRTRPIIR